MGPQTVPEFSINRADLSFVLSEMNNWIITLVYEPSFIKLPSHTDLADSEHGKIRTFRHISAEAERRKILPVY